MPGLMFRPHRQPPTWWDHTRAHPGDMMMSVAALIIGTLMLASVARPHVEAAPAIAALPALAGWTVGAILVIGGLAMLLAVYRQPRTASLAVLVYRVALMFHMAGWFSWAWALMAAPPPIYWTSVVMACCSCGGSAIGLVGTIDAGGLIRWLRDRKAAHDRDQ